MTDFAAAVREELARFPQTRRLTEHRRKLLSRYAAMLVEWNEHINLTAITDAAGVSEKHFVDSLLILDQVPLAKGASLIDVGTGAGFPGMVLAIARPDLRVTLLDSLNKRALWLLLVSEELGIRNVICRHGRAEELAAMPEVRESFDYATARAVARLDVLSEYCLPLVRKGGTFIACKGPAGEQELAEADAAIRALGGGTPVRHPCSLPSGDSRLIITVPKERTTPQRYPRRPGEAARKPIR